MDKGTLTALSQVLGDGFDLEELHDLCFRLDVDKDEFPSTKSPFISALLSYLDRHNQISALLDKGRELREELDWPQLPAERLSAIKLAIGQQDSEEVDEIFL